MNLHELLLSPDRTNHILAYELRGNWSRLEWYEAFDAVIKDVTTTTTNMKKYTWEQSLWFDKKPWFVHTVIKQQHKSSIYWRSTGAYSNYPYLIYNEQQLIKLISVDDLRPKSKSKENFKLLMQRFKQGLYPSTD